MNSGGSIGRWFKTVVAHGAGQAFAQGAAFASGIIVVREMSKSDFATYSLSAWLVASVTLIADAGISSIVLSIGQRIRGNETELKSLFQAAGLTRICVGTAATVVGLAWLCVLYVGTGVSTGQIVLALAITGVTLVPSIAIGVLQGYHRIHLDTARLRTALWLPAILRLALVSLLALAGALTLGTVLAVASVVALFTFYWLARGTTRITLPRPAVHREYSSQMRATAFRVLPAMAALVVCEQVMYALMSLRGSPDVLAEFAALSRFGLVFALFNPIISDIVAPLIARLLGGSRTVGRYTGSFALSYVGLILTLAAFMWLIAPLPLWLLGTGYEGLETALVLIFVATGISSLGYALNVIALARGWVAGSWLYLLLASVWVVTALSFARVETAEDAAWLYVSLAALWPVTQTVRIAIGLRGMRS